ncbi:MAG: YqgE/AlgH family protein [Proteobacteria bacterium]|nr:YqgE/AlgH family protein [Pseudomonadota bacterium]
MTYWRPSLAAGLLVIFTLVAVPGFGQEKEPFLVGRLLVAAPQMGDPRFAKTVIYMVSHNPSGAFGLIINRAFGAGPMKEFIKGFDIDASAVEGDIRLHYGGPVSPAVGFVLHTADYKGPDTQVVNDQMAMTTEKSVLQAIAEGRGPRGSLVAFGYAGWGAGQLEGEIAKGDWFSIPAEEKLIFDADLKTKWSRASAKVRVKL